MLVKLLSFSVLMSVGQILFKRASVGSPPLTSLSSALALTSNAWFVSGVLLYAFATVLWIHVLQHVPLARAYPFVALGFVLVPLAGAYFFDESLDGRYLLGVALIVSGILLTVRTD